MRTRTAQDTVEAVREELRKLRPATIPAGTLDVDALIEESREDTEYELNMGRTPAQIAEVRSHEWI